jgi:hypothetical protein
MVRFRAGSSADIEAVLALFDANVAWLVARGNSAQWGSEPWSGSPKLVAFAPELLSSGVVTIAEINGEAVGTSVVADPRCPMCRRRTNRNAT